LRRVFILLLASASLRADLSYQSRVQINAGEAIVTTRAIKGPRLAILTKRHTSVIDLDAETVTEIDFVKKAYAVIPFAQWKKVLEDAAAPSPREASFKLSIRAAGGNAGSTKPIGVLNAVESAMDLKGVSGGLNITIDSWVETIPGYEQMRDYTNRLAAKLGYVFAAGLAQPALRVPASLPGLEEAVRQLNQSRGAPVESSIKITTPDKTVAEVSIQLGKFGGGAQPAATFNVPDGFKKVDATVP
jgi:hypothetical protein